jgi:hypothetical protein
MAQVTSQASKRHGSGLAAKLRGRRARPMPLKDLALFTDYELKQELKITQDQPTHDYIVKLLQERAVEHLARQPEITQLVSDEINELLLWITDQGTRDSLVKVLWERGESVR